LSCFVYKKNVLLAGKVVLCPVFGQHATKRKKII
jgi:hypothetical protein